MRREDFSPKSPGHLMEVQDFQGRTGLAFLPNDLPPALTIEAEIWRKAEAAAFALGNLNGLGSQLPNPTMLARPFARKEALASSRIEGTRAEYDQLALFEVDDDRQPDNDLREVLNYVRALELAWGSSMPAISLSGIASLHEVLMRGVRGETMNPGEYRTSLVWIGAAGESLQSARFVPAPPHSIRDGLKNLVEYIDTRDRSPLLVQLAVSHYQFETIHPFNDGNGRVGRLLIPLILRHWGQLDHPLLYLSEYFERNRDAYIDGLYRVSSQGDWSGWFKFFLTALEHQAIDAKHRAESLLALREQLRSQYQLLGRPRILPVIDALFERGTITYGIAKEITGLGKQAANSLVKQLVDDGLLFEATGRQRNQVFYAPTIARASMGVIASGEDVESMQ